MLLVNIFRTKQSKLNQTSNLWGFSSRVRTFPFNLERVVPDGLRICERAAQIPAAACHRWHNAGSHRTVSQPCPHSRCLQWHPVETSWMSMSGSLVNTTWWLRHYDRTLETAASLSGPFSGVGRDLENMQFFTVRTKLPSTPSKGKASAQTTQQWPWLSMHQPL